MFYESHYPKNELLNLAKELESFSQRFLSYQSWNYRLERNLFIGFYFVRKLIESRYKITDDLKELNIEIKSFRFIGKKKLMLPVGSYDEYDFENSNIESLNIKEITHQFIHSQLFFGIKEGKGLKYVCVTSDRKVYERIYQIDIGNIIKIFRLFGENYVAYSCSEYVELTGKIKITNK